MPQPFHIDGKSDEGVISIATLLSPKAHSPERGGNIESRISPSDELFNSSCGHSGKSLLQ